MIADERILLPIGSTITTDAECRREIKEGMMPIIRGILKQERSTYKED